MDDLGGHVESRHLGRMLGASWRILQAFWGHLGMILVDLGCWGHFGAILGAAWGIEFWGYLGGFLDDLVGGCLGASWGHFGGILQGSWVIWGDLGGMLGASWRGIFGASWHL